LSELSDATSAREDGFLPYFAFALFLATILSGCVTLAALVSCDPETSATGTILTFLAGSVFVDALQYMDFSFAADRHSP